LPDYWEDDKEVIASGIPKRGVVRQFEMAGGTRWLQTDKIPYRDVDGRIIGVIGFGVDITERKKMEEEIRDLSFRDPLTALYNRRGFITLAEQQLKAAPRAQGKMLLVYLDVDNLKKINDTLGHEMGDKVLIDAADVLRRTFRESDIIARVGGDEFVVLAIEMTDLNPDLLPKRLQHTIDACNADESKPYQLSLSWGMTVYEPETTRSLDQLMSAADMQMYAQKRAKSLDGI
jgi:diguanylate cyclase (GGDEF)-like protein